MLGFDPPALAELAATEQPQAFDFGDEAPKPDGDTARRPCVTSREGGGPQRCRWRASTSARTRATASAIDMRVVSRCTASAAIDSGEVARLRSILLALVERGRDGGDAEAARLVRRIVGAAPRALGGIGVQVDLHGRLGEDDRADVAAFHHQVAVAGHRPLLRDQDRADGGEPGDEGRGAIDHRRADRRGHVDAVDGDARRVDCRCARDRRARRPRLRRRGRCRARPRPRPPRDTSRRCPRAGSRASPRPCAPPCPCPRPTGRQSRSPRGYCSLYARTASTDACMRLPRKRTVLLLVVVLLALGAWTAVPYVRAASLVIRAAGLHGPWLDRLGRFQNGPVTTRDADHPGPQRRPCAPASTSRRRARARTVLLTGGVHAKGIDEPRLMKLASDLAVAGTPVVTAEIDDLLHYRITPKLTDALEDAILWVAAEPRWRRTAASASSASASPAGCRSWRRGGRTCRRTSPTCSRSAGTAACPTWSVPVHRGAAGRDAADAARLRRRGHADEHGGSGGAAGAGGAAARGDHVLHERVTPGDGRSEGRGGQFKHALALAAALPEPSRTLMDYVNTRNVSGARAACLLPHVEAFTDDPALSPARSTDRHRAGVPAARRRRQRGAGDRVAAPGHRAVADRAGPPAGDAR